MEVRRRNHRLKLGRQTHVLIALRDLRVDWVDWRIHLRLGLHHAWHELRIVVTLVFDGKAQVISPGVIQLFQLCCRPQLISVGGIYFIIGGRNGFLGSIFFHSLVKIARILLF